VTSRLGTGISKRFFYGGPSGKHIGATIPFVSATLFPVGCNLPLLFPTRTKFRATLPLLVLSCSKSGQTRRYNRSLEQYLMRRSSFSCHPSLSLVFTTAESCATIHLIFPHCSQSGPTCRWCLPRRTGTCWGGPWSTSPVHASSRACGSPAGKKSMHC
jgi:hypothetical protein